MKGAGLGRIFLTENNVLINLQLISVKIWKEEVDFLVSSVWSRARSGRKSTKI
jgi:hypothetical protein